MDPVRPKPPTPRAAMALAKALAYQDAADAPSTLRAYASDLKSFQAWCAKSGLEALPATPEVVGAYLTWPPLAKATLCRHCVGAWRPDPPLVWWTAMLGFRARRTVSDERCEAPGFPGGV